MSRMGYCEIWCLFSFSISFIYVFLQLCDILSIVYYILKADDKWYRRSQGKKQKQKILEILTEKENIHPSIWWIVITIKTQLFLNHKSNSHQDYCKLSLSLERLGVYLVC